MATVGLRAVVHIGWIGPCREAWGCAPGSACFTSNAFGGFTANQNKTRPIF